MRDNEAHLRCMKNEVGFAYEACLRHTERGSVLRFIDVADVCFMATKLTLHIRQGECFILFAVLFTLWEFYVIIYNEKTTFNYIVKQTLRRII